MKFTEKIVIKRSPIEVFDYTQDYGNRLKWDTFLKRAELMDGATAAAKGVKAYCVAKNGIGMVTEYVTFNSPKVTAITMTGNHFMFKSFSGSWTFNEVGEQVTEVIFVYNYRLNFPFKLVGFVIELILHKDVKERLKDLKWWIELS